MSEQFPSSSMLCPWLCKTCSNGTPIALDVSPLTAAIFCALFEVPSLWLNAVSEVFFVTAALLSRSCSIFDAGRELLQLLFVT